MLGPKRLVSLLIFCVLCSGPQVFAQMPDETFLSAGNKLTYRYAMFGQDSLIATSKSQSSSFGFVTCEFVPVHGVEPGAFRVECDAPSSPTPLAWRPWSEEGYYGWRAGGLHHITSPTSSRLAVASDLPKDAGWVPRSVVVLGEPLSAICPATSEPQEGQSLFEEACWTPTYGPVFFVGVDTSEGIYEASWELIKAETPGERSATKVSVAQAKKLVKGWLWAQNTSRLQNYGWLYGSVFHGVERGAAGTGSFDRSAWLKERRKLFSRRNRVRIGELKVLTAGETTVVLFEQERDLGATGDSGLRELRLGIERGRVVIAREEMLYAQALSAP